MEATAKQFAEQAAVDKKRAEEEALRKQKKQEIYDNFATPLIGTFLNLPPEPVIIKCPACGTQEKSEVIRDLKWWATEINRLVGCLFVTFCCCFCFDYQIPCKQCDRNHYCKNCGCYFGRVMKYAPKTPKADKTTSK